MKTITHITPKDLGSLLGWNEGRLRVFLDLFDRYRVPRLRPTSYFYNKKFLQDLKSFFIKRSYSASGRYYKKYVKTIKRLDSLIGVLDTLVP